MPIIGTRAAWCPSQKTYWGNRWGKGKEELGTRLIIYVRTAYSCDMKPLVVNWFTVEFV